MSFEFTVFIHKHIFKHLCID